MDTKDIAALELRTMRSAWRALARRWGLSSAECRELLPAGGEDEDFPPRDTETRMRIMIEINYRITMPEDVVWEWLRTSLHDLGYLTPLDVLGGTLADLRGFRRIVELGFAS